jgi:hypothetical protein
MSIKIDSSKFDAWVKKALSIEKQIDGFLSREIYPYLFVGDTSKQAQRWMSQGASEGRMWRPLNSSYAKEKLKRFAKYPGGGTKLLIATGRLFGAMTGRPESSGDLNKMVQNGTLYVRIGVPYAKFVHNKRDIITFSGETYAEMRGMLKRYLAREYNVV